MTDAITEIKETYSYEDAKEIVNNGCESGVCFKHIYYADSIEFFNKFPNEITSYIVDTIGIDFMKETLELNNGWLDGYLNDLVWAFIELVCGQIVDEYESTTCEELSDGNVHDITNVIGMNSSLSKATSMAMNAIL
tara:strand:- start:41 stop:448 length:408 start_codon:yes stop_codon:yes gene_type:complete